MYQGVCICVCVGFSINVHRTDCVLVWVCLSDWTPCAIRPHSSVLPMARNLMYQLQMMCFCHNFVIITKFLRWNYHHPRIPSVLKNRKIRDSLRHWVASWVKVLISWCWPKPTVAMVFRLGSHLVVPISRGATRCWMMSQAWQVENLDGFSNKKWHCLKEFLNWTNRWLTSNTFRSAVTCHWHTQPNPNCVFFVT